MSDIKIFLDNTSTGKNTLVHKIHNSRYIFELPEAIVKHDYNISIGLESLSLCLTTYTVNTRNNILYINDTALELTRGNYNIDDFIDHVNLILVTSTELSDISCIYSETTSKITFISLAGGYTSIVFPEFGMANSAHGLFGIKPSDYVMKDLPYQCEYGVALYYSTGITVRINNLTNRNQNINGGSSSIIRLPINQPAFTVLSHITSTPFMSALSDKLINHIDISFHDDNGKLFDMEARPFFVVLRVDFQKEEVKEEKPQLINM
jgi:hypothetical protein